MRFIIVHSGILISIERRRGRASGHRIMDEVVKGAGGGKPPKYIRYDQLYQTGSGGGHGVPCSGDKRKHNWSVLYNCGDVPLEERVSMAARAGIH